MAFLVKFYKVFTGFFYTLCNFFFSEQRCLACQSYSFKNIICRKCIDSLKKEFNALEERCCVCGKILLSEKNICMECREERILFSADKAFPLFSYRLWKKNLLFTWKMNDYRRLSFIFAEFVFNAVKKLYPNGNYPVITGVPARPGKVRKRGWDQIEELCFYLKFLYGLKTQNLLLRLDRQEQKKLNRAERISKKSGRYELLKNVKTFPKEVILIDDVFTTGVTAESCSSLLKSAGVEKVQLITLFIVD